MTGEVLTLVSGVLLLVVFVLVRRTASGRDAESPEVEEGKEQRE